MDYELGTVALPLPMRALFPDAPRTIALRHLSLDTREPLRTLARSNCTHPVCHYFGVATVLGEEPTECYHLSRTSDTFQYLERGYEANPASRCGMNPVNWCAVYLVRGCTVNLGRGYVVELADRDFVHLASGYGAKMTCHRVRNYLVSGFEVAPADLHLMASCFGIHFEIGC